MRIAYFDCMSGISGDMTLGALVDAGVPFEAIADAIQSLGIAECRLERESVKRKGFAATKIHVRHEPEHAHRHLHHIEAIIDKSSLNDAQQQLARRIFHRLAEAEAKVHGSTLEKVHFHEVGAVDSIADILGTAVGLELLGVDRIECSPVPTGSGFIEIAHGRVSVPAPATAELLRGVPLAPSPVESELTTPTGAAILAATVDRFGSLPPMTIEQIGYGAGDRDFDNQANVLRLLVGEYQDAAAPSDEVWILETNIDDTTGEQLGYCLEQLWKCPVLDVYSQPIQMKKNRPATKLTVLCTRDAIGQIEELIFRETKTIGIRRWATERSKLTRRTHTVQTSWGPVQGKVVTRPGIGEDFSPEFESCREVAEANKIVWSKVYDAAKASYQAPRQTSPGDSSSE